MRSDIYEFRVEGTPEKLCKKGFPHDLAVEVVEENDFTELRADAVFCSGLSRPILVTGFALLDKKLNVIVCRVGICTVVVRDGDQLHLRLKLPPA